MVEQLMAKNYILNTVDDVTEILLKDEIDWPFQFTSEMKKALYQASISYCIDKEKYERVEKLTKKLKQLCE